MRSGWTVLVGVVAACGGAKPASNTQLCSGDSADPNACLAVAQDRLVRNDDDGVREYMDKLVTALNASPACLRDHDARGCFAGVVALLRDEPVGLLAPYNLPEALLESVPRWTGSEETGPRMQARAALVGMCTVPGRDPIAQQRACIVLGDLVEDERRRRCGLKCDDAAIRAISDWSPADVPDGYAAACRVDHTRVPAAEYAPFAAEVATIYRVPAENPACALPSSMQKGASIPGSLAAVERMQQESKAKQASTQTSAKREAERIAAMEKAKTEAAARAAVAEQAAWEQSVLDAIHRSDWAVTFGFLTKHRGSPTGEAVATAVNKIFDAFTEWAVAQANGSAAGAYLELSSRLETVPKNHAIRVSLATLRDRALVEAKATAKKAKGVGSTWLRAAVVARIAGPLFPEEQKAAQAAWAKLLASSRVSLELQNLPAACAPLMPAVIAGGRVVKAKAALECAVEAEQKQVVKEPFKIKQHVVGAGGAEEDVEQETTVDVTHRTFKVVAKGVIAIYAGAPRKAVPVEVEDIVDDTEGTDTRTYDASLAAARDALKKATVGSLEADTANKAYAAALAALKAGRRDAAENQLVIHGVITGGSAELDEIMMTYGVNFAEL